MSRRSGKLASRAAICRSSISAGTVDTTTLSTSRSRRRLFFCFIRHKDNNESGSIFAVPRKTMENPMARFVEYQAPGTTTKSGRQKILSRNWWRSSRPCPFACINEEKKLTRKKTAQMPIATGGSHDKGRPVVVVPKSLGRQFGCFVPPTPPPFRLVLDVTYAPLDTVS
jgi:hypothetical protein